MYDLLEVRAIAYGTSNRWLTLTGAQLNTIVISAAIANYRKFYMKIQAGAAPAYWADIKQVTAQEHFNNSILKTWLSTQTEYTFDEVDEPVINQKVCSYSTASQAGYMANSWDSIYGTNTDQALRPDLLMIRNILNTDYKLYHEHCLTTVGGLFYYTDVQMQGTEPVGIVIEGAMKSIRSSNVPTIGIWSFLNVSKINKYKITSEMLSQLTDNGVDPYDPTKSITITLPDQAVGKYIALSIMGHLTFIDSNAFSFLTPTTLLLDININDAMVDRYYAANSLMDLSEFNAAVKPDIENPYMPKAELLKLENLKKALMLPQSFIIVFDNNDLYVQQSQATRSVSRVQYVTFKRPNGPIMGLQGHCPEYWLQDEKKGYSIRLAASRNYIVNNLQQDTSIATFADSIDLSQDKIDYDNHIFRQDRQYINFVEIGTDRAV